MSRDFGTIIEIGDILVSEDVVTEFFSCDYPVCKGCCCIIGDSGAPLKEEELDPIEECYDSFSHLMSPAGRDAVQQKGFFEIDREGDIVTPVVPGSEECAYCHIDSDGNCLCAMEMQYLKGLTKFRKPVSCSLYPIRTVDLGGGKIGLNLHRWHICKDAYEKGKKEKVRVYEFLREPLTRAFGEEFYSALAEAARILTASS
ncbi:MAG: DUF3109 family protein [Bacteroidales bacterium]|nr:DUF3109 family protein [Bacteroidales bacterium]MBO4585275.1 DUF3109 family protein [Bacteroidales bacterium]